MRSLLLALLVLMLAVIGARYLGGDPGLVVVSYGGKVVRLSFVLFVLLLLIGIAVIHFAWYAIERVFHLRSGLRHWQRERARRRAHRSLEQGAQALAAGEFARAETLFQQGVDPAAPAAAHFLGAARAAHGLHEYARRDAYLARAAALDEDASLAVALQRAAMLIEQGREDEAAGVLQTLRRREPQHPIAARMLAGLLLPRGQWQTVIDELLPVLQQVRGEGSRPEVAALRQQAWCAALDDADGQGLPVLWARIPKQDKEEPAILTAYAAALARNGQAATAETLLRQSLKRRWDTRLIDAYARLQTDDLPRQIEFAEQQIAGHANDPDLLLALGRLYRRKEIWGAARAHLERLTQLRPSAEAWRLLGETLEALRDNAGAQRCYRDALKMLDAR